MTYPTLSTTTRLSRLLASACVMLTGLMATAAPFDRWIDFTQPDGTAIRIHGQGDEFSARFETAEGYTVVFDTAQKAYCFASKDSSGALVSTGAQVVQGAAAPAGITPGLRMSPEKQAELISQRYQRWEAGMQIGTRWNALKAAAKQLYTPPDPNGPQLSPPSFPTVGTKVGLTMLIDFSDVPATIPQSEIVGMLNGDNYAGFGNNGSVKKYYSDVSGGLLTYTNVVTIYIRAPQPKSYYADVTKDAGAQANLLIKDCVEVMKNLPNYNTEILPMFDALTTDAQNQVVAFNVFYAGDDGGVWAMGLWPHSWALYDVGPQELSPGGKLLWRYQVTNIGTQLGIGTFCHENGHMLCGYPDLYDYQYDSVGGAGYFCLMGYGNFDQNPVQISAYLKRASGWATVTELNANSSLLATISSAGTNFNHFYRYQKPGVSTEYYLVENRQQAGRDARIPGAGVAIWHCDELGDRDNQSLVYNNAHLNYEVTLMQADDRWDLENNRNAGDIADLWYLGNPTAVYMNQFSDDSEPSGRWWDGSRSGIMVADISANSQDMTARIGFGMSARVASVTVTGGNGNGIIEPNECNQLAIALYNNSDMPITGISTRLSSSTPGVIVSQPVSAYDSMGPYGTNVNLAPFQISTAPWFVCGTPIDFTLSITSDQGNGATQFRVQTGFAGTPQGFTNSVPVGIPDAFMAGTNSFLTVSNLTGALRKLTVTLFLTHTWDGDLKVQLVSPTGITNTLTAYHGFNGDNFGLSCDLPTVFDDDAATSIASGGAPFFGTFAPDEPLAIFNGLSGPNLNGTWTLHVVDAIGYDVGTLQCWSLNFTMPSCDPGPGECPGSDLGVSMTVAPSPAIIGQSLTYSISVTNRGPSTAKTVILNQVVPSGAIVNSISLSQGVASQSGGVVSCNLGAINALGKATVTVRVTPTLSGTATSSATVSSEQPDFRLSDNTVTVQTQVNPPTADLAIGLNPVPNSIVRGGSTFLTVAVTNNGPSSASPVIVTNTLPPQLTLAGSTISQGTVSKLSSNLVVCSFGTMASGAKASAVLQLTAVGEGQVRVQSLAVANQFDPISANNAASAAIAIGPAADLAMGITDSPDPALADMPFTWIAAVTNLGPSVASGVALTLDLPATATIISSSSSRGTVTNQDGTLFCDIGTMNPGAVETVTVQLSSATEQVVSGFGSVGGNEADPVPGNNSATVSTTVRSPFTDVEAAGSTLIAEGIPNGAIDAGETNTVVLRLKNIGNITTTNLTARLLATGGVQPIGANEQYYGVLAPSGWPVGKPFTFVATGGNGAIATATLELSDGATVYPPVTFSFVLPNVYHFANTNVISIPSIGTATPYPSTIAASGITGLVSKVTATLVNFNHTYPKDVSAMVKAPTGSSCLMMSHAGKPNTTPVSLTFDDGAASAILATSQLVTGSFKPSNYTPTPTFASPAPQTWDTTLSTFNGQDPNGNWSLFVIDDTSGDQGAVQQGWALDIVTVTPVNQVADLSIAGTATPAAVVAGQSVQYSFTVTNAGPNTANEVTVTNLLPANVTLVSAISSQGSVTTLGQALTANLGTLAVGATANVVVVVTPSAAAAGALSSTAAVAANETDLNQVKNVTTVTSTVALPSCDVAISQTLAAQTVLRGQNAAIALKVRNNGPGRSLDTVVTSVVPDGMVFVSAASSQGSALLENGAVVARLGDIDAAVEASVDITLQAAANGSVTNSAAVLTHSADPNLANNTAVVIFQVVEPAPLIQLVAKRIENESLLPSNGTLENGETATLLIGLANNGSAIATNVSATLVAGAGLAVTGAATQSYDTVAVGAPTVFKPFSVAASGSAGQTISAQLTVQSGGVNLGTFPVEFVLPGAVSYANTAAIDIPEVGVAVPYPSSIVITNAVGYVKSLRVSINGLTHSFPSDLSLMLAAPDGRTVMLMSKVGGAYGVSGLNLTIDDSAAQGLSSADKLTTGSWKPTSFSDASLPYPAPAKPYGSTLSTLAGSPVNGTWSLYVADDTAGDGGAITNGWSITFETLDVVNPVADLAVTLATAPSKVYTGERCTNLLTVANSGPGIAEHVTLTNILPSGAVVLESSASTGSVLSGSGVTWDVGTLANGAMATCTVVFQATRAGAFGSSASATSWATEFDLSNNTRQSSLTVQAATAVTLSAAVSSNVFQLVVSGQEGLAYVTEWSADLQSWTALSTNVIPSGGVLKVNDPANQQRRFYRTRLLSQ